VYKKTGRPAHRPSYVPTTKDRKVVESMAAYGIPHDQISLAIDIDAKTLRKHFAHELATAHIKANAKVAETAYRLGTGGKCPPATFFWLKCRAGWRETVNVDQRRIGPDGTPLGTRSS
jgi:hypothetical protein